MVCPAMTFQTYRQAVLHPVNNHWREVLEEIADDVDTTLAQVYAEHNSGKHICPEPEHIFRVLDRPPNHTKVLIVGQDPYPTPGHATGRSFAVANEIRPLPRSLVNIFSELQTDISDQDRDAAVVDPPDPDLASWASQGVMLLNEILTVRAHERAAHSDFGWQKITHHIVGHLAKQQPPPVAILWGKNAQRLAPLLPSHTTICSAHPSPLSARRGFFGSRPFTRCNELLAESGSQAIKWHFLPVGSR